MLRGDIRLVNVERLGCASIPRRRRSRFARLPFSEGAPASGPCLPIL